MPGPPAGRPGPGAPPAPAAAGAPLVLHVLPRDLTRGAQVFARALRDALDGDGVRHRTVTLFRSAPGPLGPDHRLDVPAGPLRAAGFDPRAALALRRLCGRVRPAVLVAHGGEPLKYCAAARPAGCRLVYHKIGMSHGALAGRVRTAVHRALVRAPDAVVAVSDDTAAEARTRLGCPPERVTVIPNGRDPAPFTMADHRRSEARLAFVGHMAATKRPGRFVEVVRQVAAAHPGTTAVMVGDGPLLGEVRAAARGLPIEVTGDRGDVPAILAASSVLVLPSSPRGEGMPGVCIEAGLAGLPVVATDVAGVRTIVDDGATGYVVPPDDTAALVARTLALASDPCLRARLGSAARLRCETRFTLSAAATSWAHLLTDLGARPA